MPLIMDWNPWTIDTDSGQCSTVNYSTGASPSSNESVSDANRFRKRKLEKCEPKSRKQIRTDKEDDKPINFSLRSRCYRRSLIPLSDKKTEDSSAATLSRPLWLRIFEYLEPEDLGCLLRVNRAFHSWLTYSIPSKDSKNDFVTTGHNSYVESIWKQARRRTHGQLPRPLHDFTEPEMWRLISGRKCEMCLQPPGRAGNCAQLELSPLPAASTQEPKEIRIYWTFGMRLCLDCLYANALPAQDLPLDQELLSCLPFVDHAKDQWHMKANVDTLLEELQPSVFCGFEEFRTRVQGLQAIAAKRRRDVQRWQRWEAAQNAAGATGHVQLSTLPLPHLSMGKKNKKQRATYKISDMANRRDEINGRASQLTPSIPLAALEHLPSYRDAIQHPWSLSEVEWTLLSDRLQKEYGVSTTAPKLPLTVPDAAQKDTNSRCVEIARRASLLDPPIPKNILEQLPAYTAARNIPWPLMEPEWPTLRHRLIVQAKEHSIDSFSSALPSQQRNFLNQPISEFTLVKASPQAGTLTDSKRKRAGAAQEIKIEGQKRKAMADKPSAASEALGLKTVVALPATTGPEPVSRSSSEASLSLSINMPANSRAAFHENVVQTSDKSDLLASYPSGTIHPSTLTTVHDMDIDTPRTSQKELTQAATLPKKLHTVSPPDGTSTKQKVEYLAAKLEAIGKHVLPLTAMSIEMRIVTILCRAISEYKSRYDEEPRIDLVLQTLHVSENLLSLQVKHSLVCGLCPNTFTSSGGTGTVPSLAQSIILLVLHYDIQHVDRLDLSATLQRGQVSDFFKALIALPDRRTISSTMELVKNAASTSPAILKICDDALLDLPGKLHTIVGSLRPEPLEPISPLPLRPAVQDPAQTSAGPSVSAPVATNGTSQINTVVEKTNTVATTGRTGSRSLNFSDYATQREMRIKPEPENGTYRATQSTVTLAQQQDEQIHARHVRGTSPPRPRTRSWSPNRTPRLRKDAHYRIRDHPAEHPTFYPSHSHQAPLHIPALRGGGEAGVRANAGQGGERDGRDTARQNTPERQAPAPQYAPQYYPIYAPQPHPGRFTLYDAYGRQYTAVPTEGYPPYDPNYYNHGGYRYP